MHRWQQLKISRLPILVYETKEDVIIMESMGKCMKVFIVRLKLGVSSVDKMVIIVEAMIRS